MATVTNRWHITVTAFLLILPFAGSAQKFQEPTKEELQMTADPKAPGASAVFLYREEKMDNGTHYVSSYARIKVLTELGKEWATVEIPYFAVLNGTPIIEGRTIHADGTVVPLTGKVNDLLVIKTTAANVKAAVFNLPSVEAGSILEYRWTVPMTGARFADEGVSSGDFYASALAGQIPGWDVQQRIYTHKARFYYNPIIDLGDNAVTGADTGGGRMDDGRYGHLIYTQRLPAGSQVVRSQKGDYTLEIQDVPAFSEESYAPPLDSFRYRVRFYLSPATNAEQFWSSEIARWSKELDQYASQTSAIKSAASEFASGIDSPEAKARKIYDIVQGFENTDFTRVKSESERREQHLKRELKRSEDVLSGKSGSGDQIAALYLSLARAAGLEAYGMKVVDRSRAMFDPNYLSMDQFDSLIVVVKIDGKDFYLDPGEKLCPFGQLHWSHLLTGGIEQGAKQPSYTPPNLSKDAITAHAAELKVDAKGAVTGTVKILMSGPAALRWRQLNLTANSDEVQKQFNESLHDLLPTGLTGEVDKFQGLETATGYLSASVNVNGVLGANTGKRVILPGFLFSQGARPQFVAEEKRETAVDLHFAEQVIDEVVYHVPAGFTVESTPQASQLPWPDHAALVVKTQPGPSAIDIKHIYARGFILLDPKEYPALRDYYRKLAAADQQQVVLAVGTAPGN